MVRELHRMGFERLRACAYVSGLGTWRCMIAPAAWIHASREQTSDALAFELPDGIVQLLGQDSSVHFYTSGKEQRAFENPETWFMSPYALAKQYIRHYPVIAAVGYGPDPAYVAWYERTLDLLAPNGVFYAFAEYKYATDELYTEMTPVRHAPLPPPGHFDLAEWQPFFERHQTPE